MTDLRKIDALVAEHVMGLPVSYDSEYAHLPSIIIDQATGSYDAIPHYSTDIAAAWEVVEKLCDESIPENEQYSVVVSPYWCEFEHRIYQGEPDAFHAYADTAPLAICLAALKAKNIQL